MYLSCLCLYLFSSLLKFGRIGPETMTSILCSSMHNFFLFLFFFVFSVFFFFFYFRTWTKLGSDTRLPLSLSFFFFVEIRVDLGFVKPWTRNMFALGFVKFAELC